MCKSQIFRSNDHNIPEKWSWLWKWTFDTLTHIENNCTQQNVTINLTRNSLSCSLQIFYNKTVKNNTEFFWEKIFENSTFFQLNERAGGKLYLNFDAWGSYDLVLHSGVFGTDTSQYGGLHPIKCDFDPIRTYLLPMNRSLMRWSFISSD